MAAEELKLTERELAIARGEDPDVFVAEQEVETPTETAESEATETNDSQDGQDGQSHEGSTESGSKDAASESEVADTKPADSWIDDGVKQLGAAFGMADEDLADFKSREEFDRAARVFARRALEAGKAPNQPATPEVKPESKTETEKPVDEFDPDAWKAEGYDEKTIKLVKSHREAMERLAKQEEAIAAIHQQAAEVDRNRYLNFFHTSVDSLEPELFGRSVDKDGRVTPLDAKANENRAKLWEAVHTIQAGIETRAAQSGKAPVIPPFAELLNSAKQLVFANELRQMNESKRSNAIREQAKTRRPAAAHKTAPRTAKGQFTKQDQMTISDQARTLAEDPRLASLWEQLQES